MTRLMLVRHAPTAETGRTLYGRLPGHALSETGFEMAARVAERLTSVKVAAVYASPLQRAQQTAEAIAIKQRKRVLTHDGLTEVDYGKWSGRSLKSLSKLKGWRTVITSPSQFRFPDGESLLEAQARMVRTCQDLISRHRHQTILAVSHADTIKAALSYYLGQPLDLFHRIAVAPASVAVIDLFEGRGPRVLTMNSNGDPQTWR